MIDPGATLGVIRERRPLVHNITNYVVMNETANAILALGALPVMAHAKDEVREMVGLTGALVLNIGTLSEDWIEAMLLAGTAANEQEIPVVLATCAVGAPFRRSCTIVAPPAAAARAAMRPTPPTALTPAAGVAVIRAVAEIEALRAAVDAAL